MSHNQFKECIDACYACAVACNHCATECLNEDDLKMMVRCIQLNRECASICNSSAELMSLGSMYSNTLCALCAEVCIACAEECEKHASLGMDHCAKCAEACRRCAEACEQMAATA